MADIETKVTTLEQQVSNVITKLDMFIAESREARVRQDADIRELRARQDVAQAKHDADMKEMRQDMKDMQTRFYTKMDNMDSKVEDIGNHVRNMSIVTMIGIAAMVVAVLLK